jgi:hypothetical protein
MPGDNTVEFRAEMGYFHARDVNDPRNAFGRDVQQDDSIVQDLVKLQACWVLEADLKNFFGTRPRVGDIPEHTPRMWCHQVTIMIRSVVVSTLPSLR